LVVSIQIDVSKAIRGLQNLERGIQAAMKTTLDKSAQSAIQGAQSVVPVDTGNLRDSIRVMEQGTNYVIVGSDVDYAALIEFGNGTRAAQPYLSPQADRLQSEASGILKSELENKI
jgi:HK97 gp10 family phage protein